MDNGFFQNIKNIIEKNYNVDVLIASHKTKEEIDPKILNFILSFPRCEIKYFKNIGFDWGMFSQTIDYLGKKIHRYDYVCFMHDDVKILDENILQVFSEFIENKKLIVAGNCRNADMYPFRKDHAQVLEWARLSRWRIEIKSEKWSTVRGSFFMASKKLFEKIKKIPFKHGPHVGHGNWGVIVFGGIIADIFGPNSLKTISNDNLKSPYLLEYHRGEILDIGNKYKPLKNKKVLDIGLNIHIGSQKNNLQGYLNIEKTLGSNADLIIDTMDINFKSGAVRNILIENTLEFLSENEIEILLKRSYDWLESDGCIMINLKKPGQDFLESKNIHSKWNFSKNDLELKLKNAGFKTIIFFDSQFCKSKSNRILRIIAYKMRKNKLCLKIKNYFSFIR